MFIFYIWHLIEHIFQYQSTIYSICQNFISFCDWKTFHFMCILHFISNFLLLWIMLLWTLAYKCLSESMFLAILAIYLGAELLHLMVILFNFLRNHQTVYHICCTILIPTSNALGFQWLYIFTNTVIFLFSLIIWGLVWSSISLQFWFAFL